MSGAEEVRDRPERWEVVASATSYAGRLVHVRSDQVKMPGASGVEVVTREVVVHPGSVAVVALDEAERVLLIRQYRHPAGRLLWELPAGLRDVPGEPLRDLAARELLEEAGHRAERWHTLADVLVSPGISTERSRIFLARDVSEVPAEQIGFQRVHEEADMPVAWVPLEEAVAKVLEGHIHNQLAVIGILAARAARAAGYRCLRPADAPEE
ncbi:MULTISPECIES: NUDIX domain-containing protein [Thermomonospora]|uniref:NUDIX hydrolase n=1 Tax=Thermomonospora curvata (strain ATCC 19995 / DSM 43183 / JCM 3096 / KCTC 9072 / NBRC 15933 / NCIMB 10081 / Henssen B9) TaxID=471852 RepID=D1A6X6_THECD|nr:MULTISPECIES: NUDIX hydrolase [Thermomonospora]ACY98380.1 NUDIX hydrolase [Thermomonospora curvata DSM 43183]PKK13535.1 MAG: NUDIX hydrolase [Thermomonospora sp. CIF 1]